MGLDRPFAAVEAPRDFRRHVGTPEHEAVLALQKHHRIAFVGKRSLEHLLLFGFMLPGNGLGLQNGLHHAAARDVLRAHPEFLHRRTEGVARFVQLP